MRYESMMAGGSGVISSIPDMGSLRRSGLRCMRWRCDDRGGSRGESS